MGVNFSYPRWVDTYMSILKIPLQEPTWELLQKICRSHLCTFPFENISKLIYFRNQSVNGYLIPPVEDFLEHHLRYHIGGTCYTLNSNLMSLLTEVGFKAHYVMLGNEHMGIVVTLPELNNERVYVDCGAAAPFFVPVHFVSDPNNVTSFGNDVVTIRASGPSGRYRYSRYINEELSGKEWEFDILSAKSFEDFEDAIQSANKPGSTFMSMLRCQLWQLDRQRSVSLSNNNLFFRNSNGGQIKHILPTTEAIIEAMREQFNLPLLPVGEAIQVLYDLGSDPFQ